MALTEAVQAAMALFAATTGAGLLLVTTPKAGVVRRVPLFPGTGGNGGGGNGGGGGGGNGGEGGGGGGGNGGGVNKEPMCAWNLLSGEDAQQALELAVDDISPHMILRQKLPPQLGGWTPYWESAGIINNAVPVGSLTYYITAALYVALQKTPYTVEQFAAEAGGEKYSLLLPGCMMPAESAAPGTPIRRLMDLYASSEGEF